MDAHQIDVLVQRLLANPNDREALAYAHRAGAENPQAYATVLEKVGTGCSDPAYAAYWLTEAANVYAAALGDAHRTARLLMMALEKDPTYDVAAERLAELYREKGERKALVALLERRVKVLEPMTAHSAETRALVAGMYEELGQLWGAPPLSQQHKAIERYRRAYELEPRSLEVIFALRELYKAKQKWAEALPLYEAERALVTEPERKLALYRDEASVCELAGDLTGVTAALRAAVALEPDDPALLQELATSILRRDFEGQTLSSEEREEGVTIFVRLAESYDGEHGYSYACAALDLAPGHDRAMQLAAHWAQAIGKAGELGPRWSAYLGANPHGLLAEEARRHASGAPADDAAVIEPSEDELFVADDIPGLLKSAQAAAARNQQTEALSLFKDVLAIDAAQPEALAWVEDHYRQRRQYAELRDLLVQAARSSSLSQDARKQQYREIAGLCETHLRDLDGAIFAYRQICQLDRGDEMARDQLRRLLERASRWDELAALLEQEATGAPDIETRVLLEKRLAQVHEGKRQDPVSAGEAWGRIARLLPGDESAIQTAAELFQKGERFDLAAEVIAENAAAVEDESARAWLFERLGRLREQTGDLAGAGDAFVAAARLRQSEEAWRLAEASFVAAERWEEAAQLLAELANLVEGRADLYAQEGEHWLRAGKKEAAIAAFERALAIDPTHECAQSVEAHYEGEARVGDLVDLLLQRAEKLTEAPGRIALRKRAASLQASKLGDREGARSTLLAALEDGEDAEILSNLADDAEGWGEHDEAIGYLRRLFALAEETSARIELAMREAKLLAELSRTDEAIARYEEVLSTLDANHRAALERIAELHEARSDSANLALTLERMLALTQSDDERIELARRLAKLYEGPLDDPTRAIVALEKVHALDEEDFDAVARLYALGEKVGDFEKAAKYLAILVEIEGDEEEHSVLSRKLAEMLATELDRGEEALRVLEGPANDGDAPCREAYVALGDRLGRSDRVASKLVDWHLSAPASEVRTNALRGAFDRFAETGRDEEAIRVGRQLARAGAAGDLASKLEEVALRAKDLEALALAHELSVVQLGGAERAHELVRQAEVLAKAGAAAEDAMQHGEQGLVSVASEEAEPLLGRLAALASEGEQVVDLYERQVGRCKQPAARLRALARAAEVAIERGAEERARGFFELALGGHVQEEAIEALEAAARAGDELRQDASMRRMLAEALARGGQGLRDGGKTRAALLRRAAQIADRELGDVEQAFAWLGEALAASVEDLTLEALDALAARVGEPKRVEAAIERALAEVFDGMLVRKLLAHRVELRKGPLADRRGAAEDLKRLYELAPSDAAVAEDLAVMLTELGDHHGMVQLLEDQILRGRDPHARAELARRVARIWEEKLDEPKEAADAWRRVLRMKPGDAEAQEGLDRTKAAAAQRRPSMAPGARLSSPPLRRSVPPARSSIRPAPPAVPSSTGSSPRPSVPPPPPPPSFAADATLVDEAELLESEPRQSHVSVKPPPMPPMPVAGIAHSGPPPLPSEGPSGDVMEVDDAELLDDES